ncbi:hypothetical protein LCGC14_2943580, partial [marine sediment metagenome]
FDNTLTTGDTKLIVKEGDDITGNLVELQTNNGDLGWVFISPLNFAAGQATVHSIRAFGSTADEGIRFIGVNSFVKTSGSQKHVFTASTFAPSSGTSTYVDLELNPTINQTGGANGITRGLFINPTLTAATDFRGIEVALGGVHLVAGGLDVTAGTSTFADSANVASTATMTLPAGNLFHITGTDAITTMNTCNAANNGRLVTLIFDAVLTFTDGNNLKLAGDFVTTADDAIQLICDGTNWYQTSRSVN